VPDGWEFRKLAFNVPGTAGAAGEGRLVYLVSDRDALIKLLWLYIVKIVIPSVKPETRIYRQDMRRKFVQTPPTELLSQVTALHQAEF
jgi:hypothetical protein